MIIVNDRFMEPRFGSRTGLRLDEALSYDKYETPIKALKYIWAYRINNIY
jgi:hypothetical protein